MDNWRIFIFVIMNKIKILLFPLLLIGMISCSGGNAIDFYYKSYIEGMYAGNKLTFTVDGSEIHGVTADMSVRDNHVTIRLSGFPESASSAIWDETMTGSDGGYVRAMRGHTGMRFCFRVAMILGM